jgi:hypothetical protein
VENLKIKTVANKASIITTPYTSDENRRQPLAFIKIKNKAGKKDFAEDFDK